MNRLDIPQELEQRTASGLEKARQADPNGEAALLLFTLGPVQRFIAAARRTSDLRSGSFLLSALAAHALHVVVRRLGEDVVFFPDLDSERELLDAWRTPDGKLPPDLALPNRFLAVVPAAEVEGLGAACEQAARSALAEAVRAARDEVKGWGWDEADHFLECAWVALPYADADYQETYRRLEQAMGGVKALRRFEQVESTGYRGSLVPALGAIVPHKEATPQEVNAFWRKQQQRPHLRLRAGEQLSAISLTKRRFADHVGRSSHDLFPSTASFAVADYKRDVLRALATTPALREPLEAFRRHVALLADRPEVRFQNEPALPLLRQLAAASNTGPTAHWLASLPGDWLFEDFLTPLSFQRTFDVVEDDERLRAARESLRALLQATDAADIRRPSRYYALLVFDGDRMGRWLSGEMTGGMTAAGHRAISRALGTFARCLVPHLVERQYLGRLVYSGGDDVLAFVSFQDALPLLRALRAAFSGHLTGDESGGYVVDWTHDAGSVIACGARRPTLGPQATASAGLVLAHQQEPLQEVLQSARQAEKAAKEGGRDRFVLRLGRRSGGCFDAAAFWPTTSGVDVLPLVERLAELVRLGVLSTGFLYDAEESVSVLTMVPEAVGPELQRLFGRRTERLEPGPGETREDAVQRLWQETIAPLFAAADTPEEALRLVRAAVIFGKGGDRDR